MLVSLKNILLFCLCFFSIAHGVAALDKLPDTATAPVLQEPLSTPYLIELPVNSYNVKEREQQFIHALKLVLSQSSNNQNITELPAIKGALAKPGLYVKQFNYINKQTPLNKSALFLQISFDAKAIDNLLQRTSKTVWVKNKPLSLVWLATEGKVNKILGEEGSEDELLASFRKKAQELGLPIILPTLDLQDIKGLKAQDICHLNLEAIKMASNRYQPPLIIVGCISHPILPLLGNKWSSRWLLLQGPKNSYFSFTGDNPASMVNQALSSIASNITNIVTPMARQDTKVILRVMGVNGLDQYNEVVQYLHALNKNMTQIDLINTNATEIELAINIIGGQQALLQVLSMQERLIPNPDVTISPPGIDLDYKWITLNNEKPQAANAQPLP